MLTTDLTGKRLFFMLLNHARKLKAKDAHTKLLRHLYLLGLLSGMVMLRKDAQIADNMRDYWANLNAGAD